jgi:hypothetical protein
MLNIPDELSTRSVMYAVIILCFVFFTIGRLTAEPVVLKPNTANQSVLNNPSGLTTGQSPLQQIPTGNLSPFLSK